jgi:hypothetical protein
METKNKELQEKILYINFNQDYDCFCVGTEEGYIICNVEKYKRIFHRSNLIYLYNSYRNEWRSW